MSLRAGKRRPMTPQKATPYGHRKVMLGRERRGYWIHRLVLTAFARPPRENEITRHLDGDPTNNHISNLAWGTPSENNADMVAHGNSTRGQRCAQSKLTAGQAWAIKRLNGRATAATVAGVFGVSETTIRSVWSGRTWGWLDA